MINISKKKLRSIDEKLIIPFVKWVGGKRQLISRIKKLIPKDFESYFEPFVGGGAIFFYLHPSRAYINDINSELINLYNVIKTNVDELIIDLKKHKNEADYFYSIRALDREQDLFDNLSEIEKASRVLYLNKTCYNGLYRVNQAGEFNSPFGRYKNPNIVNEKVLRAVSDYLNMEDIEIMNVDFEEALENADGGSFVYLDPPYDPVSSSSNFTGYSSGGFGREEQMRLKAVCDSLNERGAKFLLSNSSTDFIQDLYEGYKIEKVHATRMLNSVADKRGTVEEILVRNYE